jgi:methylase of polypeptide subunit release factors
MSNTNKFKLSNQALGAVMMALQRSLLEQSDIVPVLQGFDFVEGANGLIVANPPIIHDNNLDEDTEGSAVFEAWTDQINAVSADHD